MRKITVFELPQPCKHPSLSTINDPEQTVTLKDTETFLKSDTCREKIFKVKVYLRLFTINKYHRKNKILAQITIKKEFYSKRAKCVTISNLFFSPFELLFIVVQYFSVVILCSITLRGLRK